jgi:hypothetical protein
MKRISRLKVVTGLVFVGTTFGVISYCYNMPVKSKCKTQTFIVSSKWGELYDDKIALICDRFRKTYCDFFNIHENEISGLCGIVVCESDIPIKRYRRNIKEEGPIALYKPTTQTILVYSEKHDLGKLTPSLIHELTHFFNHAYYSRIPIWIDEGLSMYFSLPYYTAEGTPEPTDSNPPRLIDEAKRRFELEKIYFDKTLFSLNIVNWSAMREDIEIEVRTRVLALLYYLAKNREDFSIHLDEYIKGILGYECPLEAFTDLFEIDIDKIDGQLKEYYLNRSSYSIED